MNTKFFTFHQNNSGGYFIENDYVAHYLIIEAINAREAIRRMREITEDYSEYCPCCGVRWNDWIIDDKGTNSPMVFDIPIKEKPYDGIFGCSTIIYYCNGIKEKLWC